MISSNFSEKLFSLFEPHTRWIKKGKIGNKVELGLMIAVATDQYGFILGHKVMEHEQDVEIAVPFVKELVKKYDIDIVPVYIQFDDKMYVDRFELKASDFYNVLREVDQLPTTAAPPPKDFWEKITNSVKDYSSIFIITLTSKLSATFQSAKIAASRVKNVKVHL